MVVAPQGCDGTLQCPTLDAFRSESQFVRMYVQRASGESPAQRSDHAGSADLQFPPLEWYGVSFSCGLVGGQYNAQAVDGILHVIGQVEIFLDGFEQVFLLERTEFVVCGFA